MITLRKFKRTPGCLSPTDFDSYAQNLRSSSYGVDVSRIIVEKNVSTIFCVRTNSNLSKLVGERHPNCGTDNNKFEAFWISLLFNFRIYICIIEARPKAASKEMKTFSPRKVIHILSITHFQRKIKSVGAKDRFFRVALY